MVCLLITTILLVLKLTGIISWSWWVVTSPTLLIGAWSIWLLVKAEFQYLKTLKTQNPEVAQSTEQE